MKTGTSADVRQPGLPTIRDGDLVRCLVPVGSSLVRVRYGTVLSTTWPMQDDPAWTDHRVLWHDGGEETIEWCGELELVALAPAGLGEDL